MPEPIVLQQPAAPAQQLILLFHGFGRTADDMVPLGRRLARQFPHACVVCINAPDARVQGRGWQWYPIEGIDAHSAPLRVGGAMPRFLETVRSWQAAAGVDAVATALIGFSQGAIMSLEATRDPGRHLAGRVVAIAGCYFTLPATPLRHTTFHFIHGEGDAVMPAARAVSAAQRFEALGGDATLDLLPTDAHRVTDEMIDLVLERLLGHVPLRLWDEALSAPSGPARSGA